jgi:hypothetical protein
MQQAPLKSGLIYSPSGLPPCAKPTNSAIKNEVSSATQNCPADSAGTTWTAEQPGELLFAA